MSRQGETYSIRRREEVLNVVLAQCIRDAGLTADPENIITERGNRRMPDVLISIQGLRCVIDGKYADAQSSRQEVERQVGERIQSGLCHIGVGVLYPPCLRTIPDLKDALMNEDLQFYIATESLNAPSWSSGNLYTLLEQIRVSHTQLATDDVVTRCVEILRDGMQIFASTIIHNHAACGRLTELLGVYEESKEKIQD